MNKKDICILDFSLKNLEKIYEDVSEKFINYNLKIKTEKKQLKK